MAATNLNLDFDNSVVSMDANRHYFEVPMIPELNEEFSSMNEVNVSERYQDGSSSDKSNQRAWMPYNDVQRS